MKYDEKLLYNFTPAAFVSNFVPLVVILHAKEELELIQFEYKMWNVLTIEESVAKRNRELLQRLIEEIAEEYECEEHIYLYGNNMAGHDAILQGVLCEANAVYANNPNIKYEENDLTNLLNPIGSFPIFYLCNSSNSHEVNGFVEVCTKHGIKFNLEHCPDSECSEVKNLKEVLDFFEREISQL